MATAGTLTRPTRPRNRPCLYGFLAAFATRIVPAPSNSPAEATSINVKGSGIVRIARYSDAVPSSSVFEKRSDSSKSWEPVLDPARLKAELERRKELTDIKIGIGATA